MAALGELVVVDEVGICLLRPTPRRLIEFIREGARGHGDLDALRRKEAELPLVTGLDRVALAAESVEAIRGLKDASRVAAADAFLRAQYVAALTDYLPGKLVQ